MKKCHDYEEIRHNRDTFCNGAPGIIAIGAL